MRGATRQNGPFASEALESRLFFSAQLDPSFAENGIVDGFRSMPGGLGHAIVVQPDGKIILAGQSADDSGVNPGVATPIPSHLAMVRLNRNGLPDTAFGTGGQSFQGLGGTDEGITSLALQPDGKILVAGFSNGNGAFVGRYDSNGTPDPTFGSGGFSVLPFGDKGTDPTALAVQSDGKIVVVGTREVATATEFGIARYTASGTLDASFATAGMVEGFAPGASGADCVAITADGAILVGGQIDYSPAIARVTPSGSIDTTFGAAGIFLPFSNTSRNGPVVSLAVTHGGRILAAGTNDFPVDQGPQMYVAAGTPAGALDPQFGQAGLVEATLPDPSYIGAVSPGYGQPAPTGSPNAYATSMTLQPDGRIVVVGGVSATAGNDVGAIRFTASGKLDPTFGHGGKVVTGSGYLWLGSDLEANGVAVDKAGRIVIVGQSLKSKYGIGQPITQDPDSQFIAARYSAAGGLDKTFGNGGRVGSSPRGLLNGAYAVAVEPDGKPVVAYDPYTLARFTTSGTLDPTFGNRGRVVPDVALTDTSTLSYEYACAILTLPNGKVLVGGTTLKADGSIEDTLIRYNANGTRDASFGSNGRVMTNLSHGQVDQDNSTVAAIAVQPDGKIVVADTTQTNSGFTLARYNANGSLDGSFGKQGIVDLAPIDGTSNAPGALLVLPGGDVVVGGSASNDGGATGPNDFVLAALKSDGALDRSFGTSGTVVTPTETGQGIAALRLLGSGELAAVGGSPAGLAMARYDLHGRPDAQFGSGGVISISYPSGDLQSPVVMAPDGSVYVVDQNTNDLLNFSATGQMNATFGAVTVSSNGITGLALAAGGGIYASLYGPLTTLARVRP